MTEDDPEYCPNSKDGCGHCRCWWDGHDPCCWCKDNSEPCDCEDEKPKATVPAGQSHDDKDFKP